jgi:GNAT superfamily N-acetyltransferase
MSIVTVKSASDRSALVEARGLPGFDARKLEQHAVDAHLCALGNNQEIRAHCSLWWEKTPPLAGHRVGAIGHYAGIDGADALALLGEAEARLRAERCTIAIGPMDGNTWRQYRFVTGAGEIQPEEPAFFLEPTNPAEWPRNFEAAGFSPIAQYYSALNSDLARPDERIAAIFARLQDAGIQIHSAHGRALEEELRRIYEVSRIAFTQNFLYTELPQSAFLAQYTPILGRIQPELILLAERGPELVGYLFAVPDFAQTQRGTSINTAIIKTVAILPQAELRGLGSVLVARAHQAAHKLGFQRAIHALMHENNVSRNISRHYAQIMRQYTLYGMELGR